ncbi:DUF3662 domain-containing protein [Streptomyces sp. NPDC002564]|uniref:DUF3662 domain-containing protein n=1 Tax=Streptomyces sp. NPDC002564 TaxID=3364649 RepID=UPI0036C55833
MGILNAVEGTMERWIDLAWSKVHPRQQQGAVVSILRRECDERALILERGRTVVPNSFTVELPRQSHARLAPEEPQLGLFLAHEVHRHAAEQGYSFAGPVAVDLRPAQEAVPGRFRILSRITPAATTDHHRRP